MTSHNFSNVFAENSIRTTINRYNLIGKILYHPDPTKDKITEKTYYAYQLYVYKSSTTSFFLSTKPDAKKDKWKMITKTIKYTHCCQSKLIYCLFDVMQFPFLIMWCKKALFSTGFFIESKVKRISA